MTRGQRLTFLGIAVVIAVVAVILLAGGGDETDNASNSAQTATATATPAEGDATAAPTPTATATPRPKPPLLQAGKVRTLTYNQGDTVRFRVRSDKAEEVHIHGYDIKKDLEAGETATVSFKASITGIFEIEFEGSATQIAELKVEP